MGSSFTYSGLNTKIHGMRSKLISPDEYNEITGLSSVPDVIQYLASHPGYSGLFPDTPDDNFYHRENLEQILTVSLYENFSKIYTFSTMKQRKFLELYFMHFEIRLIKKFLRRMYNDNPLNVDIPRLEPYFERFSDIPVARAGQASDIDELINALEGTIYEAPLKKAHDLSGNNLFNYEISLDLLQYKTFWKQKGKFMSGTDLDVITDAYGYKIDLLNIQWIYRCKKYYTMTTSDILSMVIPIHYKLKKQQLIELADTENAEAFLKILKTTIYGKGLDVPEDVSVEKCYRKLMHNHYVKIFRQHPYSLACVSTYLYLQERETETLTHITECIRYSYPPEDIRKFLKIGGEQH